MPCIEGGSQASGRRDRGRLDWGACPAPRDQALGNRGLKEVKDPAAKRRPSGITGMIACKNLHCQIRLFPRPRPCRLDHEPECIGNQRIIPMGTDEIQNRFGVRIALRQISIHRRLRCAGVLPAARPS